jgi:transcriptional regulator with XRE-family HTH domain
MRLNEKLRTLREKCGYTQEQVAKILSVDRSSYTYYETGKTEPSIASLRKLASLYKVNLDELLGVEQSDVITANDSGEKRKHSKKASENDSFIYNLDKNEKLFLGFYRSMDAERQKLAMDAIVHIALNKPEEQKS